MREKSGVSHDSDFLMVESMGRVSSIALGVAAQKLETTVWCIDGDGTILMHMGAVAVMGASGVKNIMHVVLDNGSHETVGGVPTVARSVDLGAVAKAGGYRHVERASSADALEGALACMKVEEGPSMSTVDCAKSG